jgi:hypothetical protein
VATKKHTRGASRKRSIWSMTSPPIRERMCGLRIAANALTEEIDRLGAHRGLTSSMRNQMRELAGTLRDNWYLLTPMVGQSAYRGRS